MKNHRTFRFEANDMAVDPAIDQVRVGIGDFQLH